VQPLAANEMLGGGVKSRNPLRPIGEPEETSSLVNILLFFFRLVVIANQMSRSIASNGGMSVNGVYPTLD
jgi:hypothetical protein